MVPNDELEKMKLPNIKINHLFFAMTFFIQKFDDKVLTEYLFKIFFSEGLDKSFFRLNKVPLEDPIFYSFEYKNENIIGNFNKIFAMKSISVNWFISAGRPSLERICLWMN